RRGRRSSRSRTPRPTPRTATARSTCWTGGSWGRAEPTLREQPTVVVAEQERAKPRRLRAPTRTTAPDTPRHRQSVRPRPVAAARRAQARRWAGTRWTLPPDLAGTPAAPPPSPGGPRWVDRGEVSDGCAQRDGVPRGGKKQGRQR